MAAPPKWAGFDLDAEIDGIDWASYEPPSPTPVRPPVAAPPPPEPPAPAPTLVWSPPVSMPAQPSPWVGAAVALGAMAIEGFGQLFAAYGPRWAAAEERARTAPRTQRATSKRVPAAGAQAYRPTSKAARKAKLADELRDEILARATYARSASEAVQLGEPAARDLDVEIAIVLGTDTSGRVRAARVVVGERSSVDADLDVAADVLSEPMVSRIWYLHSHPRGRGVTAEPSGEDQSVHLDLVERFGESLADDLIFVAIRETASRWGLIDAYSHAKRKRFEVRPDPHQYLED